MKLNKTKPPRKHAIWLGAFPKQSQKLNSPALAHRGRRLALAKTMTVRSDSVASRKAAEVDLKNKYRARVKVFLKMPENQFCWCCFWRGVSKVRRATNVHHSHGRGYHLELLLIEYLWIPCCSKCHPEWIHNNIDAARDLGLYAPRGEWNRIPK